MPSTSPSACPSSSTPSSTDRQPSGTRRRSPPSRRRSRDEGRDQRPADEDRGRAGPGEAVVVQDDRAGQDRDDREADGEVAESAHRAEQLLGVTQPVEVACRSLRDDIVAGTRPGSSRPPISTCRRMPTTRCRSPSRAGPSGPARGAGAIRGDKTKTHVGIRPSSPPFGAAAVRSPTPSALLCRWPPSAGRRWPPPASLPGPIRVDPATEPVSGVRQCVPRWPRPVPSGRMNETATRRSSSSGPCLLVAAARGWRARRVGLPAIVGYLAVGVAVSPFTPGYVADREQIQLLADVGVVLLLFEVGIEVDLARLRREQRGLPGGRAAAGRVDDGHRGGRRPRWPASRRSRPLSSGSASRCRRAWSSSTSPGAADGRRTRRPSEALLGWSVVQDLTGVALAVVLLAARPRTGQPARARSWGCVVFAVVAVVAARLAARRARRLRAASTTCSSSSQWRRPGPRRDRRRSSSACRSRSPRSWAGSRSPRAGIAAEARRRLLPFRDVFAVLFFVAIGTLVDPRSVGPGLPLARGVRRARRRRQDRRRVCRWPGSLGSGRGPLQLGDRPRPDRRVQLRARTRRLSPQARSTASSSWPSSPPSRSPSRARP